MTEITDTYHQPDARTSHLPWPLGGLIPVIAAIVYPLLLNGFASAMGDHGETEPAILTAWLYFIGFLVVPLIGLLFAWRVQGPPSQRRLAYACVLAPTLYVGLGVITYMFKARIADEILWAVLWAGLLGIAWASPDNTHKTQPTGAVSDWRVVHGVTATLISLFLIFHLFNHLLALFGDNVHDNVRWFGAYIYRARFIEPLLALALLFQVMTGVRLVWRWSSQPLNFYRTVQLATGAFLAVYILGHMLSVFVLARSWLGIPTDFHWASGGNAGLIHSAWNIRLLPHYLLGVFALLVHLNCGWRHITLKHGHTLADANRLWWLGTLISALITTLIVVAMLGVRLI